MELRRELFLGVGVVVGIMVLTVFGAIVLLTRMGPAIHDILEENLSSLEAVESMLVVLAEPPGESEPRARFESALRRASENLTQESEREIVQSLRRNWTAALAGDDPARRRTFDALARLSALHRQAMRRTDEEARRLSAAGAWSAVFLGTAGFTIGLLALARLRRGLLEPVLELHDVLTAPKSQQIGRRCTVSQHPEELKTIQQAVNELLDQRIRAHDQNRRDVERSLTTYLLDRISEPAVAVDARGEVVAANRRALTMLQAPGGPALRSALKESADNQQDEVPERFASSTAIGATGGRLLLLNEDATREPSSYEGG